MNEKKPGGRPWVKILVILGIIIVFLILFDVELIVEAIRDANWAYLAAAGGILLIGYVLMAKRLQHLLSDRSSLSHTFHAMNVSSMMNLLTFIPATPIRIFLLGEDDEVTIPQATSSVSIAIVIDWVMKIIAILGAILLTAGSVSIGQFLLVGVILVAVIIGGMLLLVANGDKVVTKLTPLLARLPIISEEQSENLLSGLMEGLKGVGSVRHLIVTYFWTILAWICGVSFYFIGMLAMGISLPADLLLAGALFATVIVNPFSPYLPGIYQTLLVAAIYIVVRGDADFVLLLVAFSIVIYLVTLVLIFGLGYWGLRGLNLKFSELRDEIAASIQEMQAQRKQEEGKSEQT
jgi:hypothetical protein